MDSAKSTNTDRPTVFISWQVANGRLYDYCKDSTEEYPETLGTLDGVYWRRMSRGNERYNCKKLDAFSAELAELTQALSS